MDYYFKPTKPSPNKITKSSSTRAAPPYPSKHDRVKEICCIPRPVGNVFTSFPGHQVSQRGGNGRDSTYYVSRNLKLARQFNQPTVPVVPSAPDSTAPAGGVLAASTVQPVPAIFRNCCVYVNGYMGPLVSDIELKKKLARHGARVVTNFGRKSVTHVILGPNGLAGGKIQKEMLARKVGVKYVTVDWYGYFFVVGV